MRIFFMLLQKKTINAKNPLCSCRGPGPWGQQEKHTGCCRAWASSFSPRLPLPLFFQSCRHQPALLRGHIFFRSAIYCSGRASYKCVQLDSLPSLFRSFSTFHCRCVLYWQVHVNRFEKANLFVFHQSQSMNALVFLSTRKCGLLGFTNSYWAGCWSPFRLSLFLDLEFSGSIWSVLNAWLILVKNCLISSVIRSRPFISHDSQNQPTPPQTNV